MTITVHLCLFTRSAAILRVLGVGRPPGEARYNRGMAGTRTWTVCIRCGKRCPKWRNRRLVSTCDSCRVAAMVENANGIRTRTGPAYDRWREGMIRYADRLRS